MTGYWNYCNLNNENLKLLSSCLIFIDGHVLQLWSETVVVLDGWYMVWMILWPYDNRGRMWPKFADICLTVEGKPRKKLNQEIDPTEDRTRARCVRVTMLHLDQSGGQKIKVSWFVNIQSIPKFLLQNSRTWRGDWVDNVLNRNPYPETYRFRAAGKKRSN